MANDAIDPDVWSGRVLVWSFLASLPLAGQEHRRTIPLTDLRGSRITHHSARHPVLEVTSMALDAAADAKVMLAGVFYRRDELQRAAGALNGVAASRDALIVSRWRASRARGPMKERGSASNINVNSHFHDLRCRYAEVRAGSLGIV